MDNLLKDFKYLYGTYFILIAIFIFVVSYIIFNYDQIINKNNIFYGDYIPPILVTGIILLVLGLIIPGNDDIEFEKPINYQVLKIVNNENELEKNMEKIEKELEMPLELENKRMFKIINDNNKNNFNSKNNMSNNTNNNHNNNVNNKNKLIGMIKEEPSSNNKNNKKIKYNKGVFLPHKENKPKFQLKV